MHGLQVHRYVRLVSKNEKEKNHTTISNRQSSGREGLRSSLDNDDNSQRRATLLTNNLYTESLDKQSRRDNYLVMHLSDEEKYVSLNK